MATYCYTCDECGLTHDLVMPMDAQRPQFVPCTCGASARRDFMAERPGLETDWSHPIHSTSSGVHVKQIPEFRAYGETVGVAFDFDARGRAVYTSRKHRHDCLAARGMIDQDAGYSDP